VRSRLALDVQKGTNVLTVHRYHEISEASHLILNPLSIEKLALVEDICSPSPGNRVLDLGCGTGEMLCRFASRFGTTGLGIDIHPGGIDRSRRRARELGVDGALEFCLGDGAQLVPRGEAFDIVATIGTSWIGGGLIGTLELLRTAAAATAWYLAGDVFWERDPTDEAIAEYGHEFHSLSGTLALLDEAGFDLVEMALANTDEWDRYAASQWLNVSRWLVANPDDPDTAEVRQWRDRSRRSYLRDRGVMGWGIFVLRAR
jgi:SAM-dependent methyltransferase